ncbi:restriction endonuclease subunit S [Dendronalium sp. ChiSLP03b]|uniref:restriction endonuclease subunit S n=1 Tax=Dendronalium sp. ChiSLP03b TaxID=3075381 RepID=UPI002AD3AC09|nr:restriction endonuclease subunit S [Dendronalium sp. ChiSLP03b]MDZ8206844.1 restriction endonuclease subunit S [Dendronalium sp. ChiSLP03b]
MKDIGQLFDGPHATPPLANEGAIFLGIKNISEDGHLNFSEIRYVSEQDFPLWIRRVTPQKGDIVFTYEATLHRYAIIPEGFRGCLGRRVALLRPKPDSVDTHYLFYYFRSHMWKAKVEANILVGATVDRVPIARFPDFTLNLPPLATQQRIADILSTYDRLIDNNNRRIALLEESIHQLYKEWFVRSRFPGYESVKVVDGIPEGWNRIDFSEALILQRGFDLPNKDRKPGDIPVYASTGINGYHDTSKVKAPGVVTGRSGSLGSVMYVQKDFWPLNTTLWVKEFKKVTPPFAYCLLSQMDLNSYQAGAAVPTLNRNVIHGVKILVPCEQLQSKFDNFANSIIIQIEVLKKYNYNLRQARDLLLPRLMNGSIAV